MVKVSVKDFGPIIEGDVELKPLTIFVGPNNAGKSYMAMLMYALLHSSPLGGYFDIHRSTPRRFRSRLFRVRREFGQEQEDEVMSELGTWLASHSDEIRDNPELQFSSPPHKFKQNLEKDAELSIKSLKNSLTRELPRCFGSELAQLSKRTFQDNGFNVSLEHTNPKWGMNISPDEKMNSDKDQIVLSSETFVLSNRYRGLMEEYNRRGIDNDVSFFLADEIAEHLLYGMYQQLPSTCYYLPAARSGNTPKP